MPKTNSLTPTASNAVPNSTPRTVRIATAHGPRDVILSFAALCAIEETTGKTLHGMAMEFAAALTGLGDPEKIDIDAVTPEQMMPIMSKLGYRLMGGIVAGAVGCELKLLDQVVGVEFIHKAGFDLFLALVGVVLGSLQDEEKKDETPNPTSASAASEPSSASSSASIPTALEG